MSDEMEQVLRRSLDAVDRAKRWTTVGLVALFVAMAIGVGALIAVAAHTGSGQSSDALILKALWVASAAQMLFVACCSALVMFHFTRTARAILRSIDGRR